MDSSYVLTAAGWIVSAGTAVYLIHYKGQSEKRRLDEERRFANTEAKVLALEVRVAAHDVGAAARDGQIANIREKQDDLKVDINSKLGRLDDKMDKMTDKLDQALAEHRN
jgi:hypothetical protein